MPGVSTEGGHDHEQLAFSRDGESVGLELGWILFSYLRLSLACAGELVGFGIVPIVTSQHEPQVRPSGMGPDRVAPLARSAAKPASSQEGFQDSHFHGRSISSLSDTAV